MPNMPNFNYPQGWYNVNPPMHNPVGAGNAQEAAAINPQANAVNNAADIFYGEAAPAPADPDALHGMDYFNALIQDKAKKMYGKASKIKVSQTSSQMSEEYLDLIDRTAKLEASIRLESEELERVLETIATQVEVVRDIGSQVRTHISSLQMAAIQLEKWRLTLPQPESLGSGTRPVGGRSAPAGAAQTAQVGQVEVAPGLLLQDQE